jgi:hypothetical protein
MLKLAGKIRSDYDGFKKLVLLHRDIQQQTIRPDGLLEIDMRHTRWMDANMCAPFGAILYAAQSPHYRISGLCDKVMTIIQKNGFLPNFGFDREKLPDLYGTTIEYSRFERTDAQAFKNYVARHFVGRAKGLPKMSAQLQGKFRESISEIFENAVDHSNSKMGIFTCGQFFPGKHDHTHARLDFSIADLGDGMRKVISNRLGIEMTSQEAIKWAVAGTNTTRQRSDGKPGGLGLKLIKDFINLNQGRLQIVSDSGYWSFTYQGVEVMSLESPFPGTIVNIEINAADKQSYRLASEVDPANIF